MWNSELIWLIVQNEKIQTKYIFEVGILLVCFFRALLYLYRHLVQSSEEQTIFVIFT